MRERAPEFDSTPLARPFLVLLPFQADGIYTKDQVEGAPRIMAADDPSSLSGLNPGSAVLGTDGTIHPVGAGGTPAPLASDADVVAAQADATSALAKAAARGAENTDCRQAIPLIGLKDGGTWTPGMTSGGLASVTRTAAVGSSSYWLDIPIGTRTTASKGRKPTGVRVNYSVATADVDNVRFEVWKVTEGANGAARTAVCLFGDDNADYDADHNTSAKRGLDTANPQLHLAVVTDAGTPAYLGAGETLKLRCFVEGDPGGLGTVVITGATLVYAETPNDLT